MNSEPENTTEEFDGLCGQTEMEGAHASAIHRLIKETPPFRPEASAEELVSEFANGKNRMAAFLALYTRGVKALPAVREGLKHANWQIRRWSAIFPDQHNVLRPVVVLFDDQLSGGESESDAGTASPEWRED
jgi:hypothetical protein